VVVDASAVVEALLEEAARKRLAAEIGDSDVFAPEMIDAEVLSALRGKARSGQLSEAEAHERIVIQSESSIVRVPHAGLLPAAWRLRHNVSAYDALYVALAQALDTRLIVADARLARAPGLGITITVLPSD